MMWKRHFFQLLLTVLLSLVSNWVDCQTEGSCGHLYVKRTELLVGSNITATCYFCTVNASATASWEYGQNIVPSDLYLQINSTVSTVMLSNLNLTSKDGQNLSCKSETGEHYSVNIYTGYPADEPKDLYCITADLAYMNCSWNAGSDTNLKTVYTFCTGGSTKKCWELVENIKREIEIELFGLLQVTITSKNSLGSATEIFYVSEQDIWAQPSTPQIHRIIPDYSSSTLFVEYSTKRLFDEQMTCQFEVFLTEKMEIKQTDIVTSGISPVNWTWTSDIPLECTSLSVTARCKFDDPFIQFKNLWSNWSPTKTIQGKEPSTDISVYPIDKVVSAGSNMTFCCIPTKGNKINTLQYGNEKNLTIIDLGSDIWALTVYKLEVSDSSGTNVVCILDDYSIGGTVVFAGYPPDVPQDFSCETHDMESLTCVWKPGRTTGLDGPRRTNYALFESLSGRNQTCDMDENIKPTYKCDFSMPKGQRLYSFTLEAQNPLGRTEAQLAFDVTHRVHLDAPSNFMVKVDNSTHISMFWSFTANYTSFPILCETEIRKSVAESELRNYSMLGGQSSTTYSITVDKLYPDTSYTFRIRCATVEPFWEWSNWSEGKTGRTLEAPPSNGPDVWRQINGNGPYRTVTIFWKPLSHSEANGKLLSYNITWEVPRENSEPKHISVSAAQNSTNILIDEREYMVAVTAENSAGSSPASLLWIAAPSNEVDIMTEIAIGTGDGVKIDWQDNDNVTCGYVVEWYNFPGSQEDIQWEKYPSNFTSAVIESDAFQPGVRYQFSVYGCQKEQYQLLEKKVGYTEELAPNKEPDVSVNDTTSSIVVLNWDEIPVEHLQGFLRGYMVYLSKQENTTSRTWIVEQGNSVEPKKRNITDPTVTSLKIDGLQSGTSYSVGVAAYTRGGEGPQKINYVVTKTNISEILVAVLVPVAVAVCLGLIFSIGCYKKRRWIKEAFYPKIPNPEHSKALNFDKSPATDGSVCKTMEMNPCTPNSLEVVEAVPVSPKIEDTDLYKTDTSEDANDQLPEDRSDSEATDHVVISYYPPIVSTETEVPPNNETEVSEPVTSQVVYMELPNPEYQHQSGVVENPAQNDVEPDCSGYKPQIQVPSSLLIMGSQCSLDDEPMANDGYQPQLDLNGWHVGSPESPSSTESDSISENMLIGSPCSTNSRQYLISEEDNKDSSKSISIGWSFPSLFQNRPND